jgi:ABC-type lipoprotein export system ATPase subunit
VNAVEIRDLFRVHRTAEGDAAALQGLTLEVAQGEIVTILGPSGSGKSTLLRTLAALEPPSAGVVLVLGQDVGRLSAAQAAAFRARELGIVDQHYDRALSPDMSCADIIGLQSALLGIRPAARRARAEELLERVGLAGRADARPGELSGGEQQRVAVCAALAHDPRLLLADEPSGELDEASAELVYDLISGLVRDIGATAIVVSHDPGSMRIANRTLRIRDGRVAEEVAAGRETAVVARGGWIRIPPELLTDEGLGERVVLEPGPDGAGVLVRPSTDGPAERPAVAPAPTPPTAGKVVASMDGITVRYGQRIALDGVDLRAHAGALTCVTGRSGSGKSTLLSVLAGMQRPDGGSVTVLGEPLEPSRERLAARRARQIATAGQQPGLAGFLSPVENITLTLAARGVPDEEGEARAREELRELGLSHRADQRVERLSAGERQRVAIARALAARAPLVLLDEPTSRLDQGSAELVADRLAATAAEGWTAVVCATHDPLVIGRATARLAL